MEYKETLYNLLLKGILFYLKNKTCLLRKTNFISKFNLLLIAYYFYIMYFKIQVFFYNCGNII